MSIIRSDNRQERHPKPVQDFERKFNGTGYEDWADVAELEAAYNVEYRKNKYFWINDEYFECLDDGVTYRQIGGNASAGTVQVVTYLPDANSDIITVSELTGHTFYIAIMATQSFDTTHVSQTGDQLDFSLVGGVQDGILITIFFT